MITGLLFTLAQKQPFPSNDEKGEGRHFPASKSKPALKSKRVKVPMNVVRLTQIVSATLTVIGIGLLSLGSVSWSLDPAFGLNVQTAGLCFTLPVGVFS